MSFLESFKITSSALTATRLRIDVIAENMANINTTRTEAGEPYRRRFVVYQQRTNREGFSSYLNRAGGYLDEIDRGKYITPGAGVRVAYIGEDQAEFKLDYNPTHPDADADGYVRLPNVEVVQEMVDMMSAYRAYEANITAFNTMKDMASKTLEMGR
jgi:flagellar basal-body rod protein FlgC